jgi:TetR/AcrR family transcriptional regulator, tetracycline repressor protein
MISKRASAAALSRDAVIERAMELADAEGLDAVTIRRLGQEFGVTPMALYWHVKNKDELLDAMGDRLFTGLRYDAAPDAPWDEQLRAVIQGLGVALRRHPACVDLAFRRVLIAPEGRAVAEHTFGVLRQAGFSSRQTADIATFALQTAIMLVRSEPGAEPGCSPEEAAERLAQKRAGLETLPAEDYPYIRELADDLLDCDDPAAYYAFGIDVFIAGARSMLSPAAV